jgi:F0F1-type ATP synthase membrane subunit a
MAVFSKPNTRIFLLVVIIVIVFILSILFYKKKETFENSSKIQELIEGVKGGDIDNAKITEYIKNNKLSKEELDEIIKKL